MCLYGGYQGIFNATSSALTSGVLPPNMRTHNEAFSLDCLNQSLLKLYYHILPWLKPDNVCVSHQEKKEGKMKLFSHLKTV